MIDIAFAAQSCSQKKIKLKDLTVATFAAIGLAKSVCTRPGNL